jgi:uncharacterized protein (TIRG00374 family)
MNPAMNTRPDMADKRFLGLPGRAIQPLKFAFGFTMILILLLSVDLQQLFIILADARLAWIPVCFIATFLIFQLQVILLRLVCSPFAYIPYLSLLAFAAIGRFFSIFLPSYVGGDVIKGIYLLPFFRDRSSAYAAVIVQRIIGGLATFTIAFLVCALAFLDLAAILLLCGTAAAIVIIITLFKRPIEAMLYAAHSKFRERYSRFRILRVLLGLISAIAAFRYNRFILLKTFAISLTVPFFAVVIYMLAAYTLRLPLTFQQAIVPASVSMLSVLLPLTPGGLGVGESAFVISSGYMGVPPEHSLTIALFVRILNYSCGLIGGVVYLFMPIKSSN